MNIEDLMTEEKILLHADIHTKEEMIEQLSGLLTGGTDSKTKSRLMKEVWKRERMDSLRSEILSHWLMLYRILFLRSA